MEVIQSWPPVKIPNCLSVSDKGRYTPRKNTIADTAIPPAAAPIAWYWQHFTKGIFLFPVAVQTAVFANDVATLKTGMVYSAGNTVVVFMLSFARGLVVVLLTMSSFRIWFTLERFWLREARRMGLIPGPDPLLGPGPDREEDLFRNSWS